MFKKIVHSLVAASFLFFGAPAFASYPVPLGSAAVDGSCKVGENRNNSCWSPQDIVRLDAAHKSFSDKIAKELKPARTRPDFRQTVAFIQNGAPLYMRELNQIEKAAAAPFNAYSVGTLGVNCSQQGSIMFQSANGQSKCLGAGVSGQVVKSGGPGADIAWLTTAGTGTVTSVGMTAPAALFAVGGSPITAAGTLALTLQTQTANTIWAGPGTGVAAAPTFRALVNADIPAPTLSALGGVEAINAVASNWIRSISTGGIPALSQPNFTDLAGSIAAGQIPANLITNAALAQMAAATIKGNPAAALANGSDFTIQGLTDISAPNLTLDFLLIFNHTTGTFQKTTAQEISTVIGGGVASFNGRTGAVVPAANDYSTAQLSVNNGTAAQTAGRIGEKIQVTSTEQTATIVFTNGSSTINWPSHGLILNQVIRPSTGGTAPTNFTNGGRYFVVSVIDANNITVSATVGGTAIVAGSAGVGTQIGTATATLVTGVWKSVNAVVLTPGDWNCDATILFDAGASTTVTSIQGFIGTVLDGTPTIGQKGYSALQATFATSGSEMIATGEVPFLVNTNTPVYMNSLSAFAVSNMFSAGSLMCRRMD